MTKGGVKDYRKIYENGIGKVKDNAAKNTPKLDFENICLIASF